ncbi:MAG: PilZ domain-containing protein [Planctomycetes bacterium]|nr:PilZ domain-containing protein [Planctomycetota bacterium]
MVRADRRSNARARLREAFAVLRLVGGELPANRVAKVSDISAGGLTLTAWACLNPGDRVMLAVNLPILDLACEAEVVWARGEAGKGPMANAHWVAGVQFLEMPREAHEQIERLLANPMLGMSAWGKGTETRRREAMAPPRLELEKVAAAVRPAVA